MSKFVSGEKELYFIHIPRTAGRHIIKLFLVNGWNLNKNEEKIRGVNSHHLHYPLYDYYLNVKNLPKFCVVRNPYDKFISSISQVLHNNEINIDFILSSKENLFDYLTFEKEITSYETNWFLEQYKFLSPITKVWKYEYGFGENFLQWISEKFNINLSIKCEEYTYDRLTTDFYDKLKCKDEVKGWIREYYSKDYQLFNYNSY